MHLCSLFCTDIKINKNKKNLVAVPASRFFLSDNDLHLFNRIDLHLVPPKLDFPRKFKIERVNNIKNKKIIEISLFQMPDSRNFDDFNGCSFLIRNSDLQNFPSINKYSVKDFIDKKVVDDKLGYVGVVENYIYESKQKLLVVSYNNNQVYIPVVDEIIKSVNYDCIYVSLPAGLLEINN